MAAAAKGDKVTVEYTVRIGDGRVVGGTERDGPQTLTLGEGGIFEAVEQKLEGLSAGEEASVTVPSSAAFGPRRDELVLRIPREQLPEGEPQPGMQLAARAENGETVNLTITEVGADAVTADGNHPLAGEDLHFALTLVEVKKAA